jgi:hypothetical protein
MTRLALDDNKNAFLPSACRNFEKMSRTDFVAFVPFVCFVA